MMETSDLKALFAPHAVAYYSQFASAPANTSGKNPRLPCPIHGGEGFNFEVFADGGYCCHSRCGSGDVFSFLQEVRDLTFSAAKKEVAQHCRVDMTPGQGAAQAAQPKPRRRAEEKQAEGREEKPRLDPQVAMAAHQRLMDDPGMLTWLSEKRGLTLETLKANMIGLDQRPDDLKNGVQRVTFPVFDDAGGLRNVRRHLFAYTPELTVEKRKALGKTKPWQAGLPTGLFPIASLRGADTVLLIEGEPDALLANQMGFRAVTGTLGAGSFESPWLDSFRHVSEVIILYDRDEAGAGGRGRAASLLATVVPTVRHAEYPEGVNDLGEWVVERGATRDDLERQLKAAVLHRPAGSPDSTRPETTGWEHPQMLPTAHLPDFPLEALPPVIADYVFEVAATVQVPPELPAMMALSVIGAAGCRSCVVRVGETHSEPLNLWTATAMPPGSRKSPAVEAIALPIESYEWEMRQAAEKEIKEATEKRKFDESRLKQSRDKAAAPGAPKDPYDDSEGDLTEIPPIPRFLADDVTTQQLATLIAENGSMAVLSAEGGILDIVAGRYSKGQCSDLDLYLKGHAGEPYRVDRKGRPAEYIPRTLLTMGLAIQPALLDSLAAQPGFRGRGLLARFLYSLPASIIGTRMYRNRPIKPGAKHAYCAAVRAVLDLPQAPPDDGKPVWHHLRLEGMPLRVWARYADDVERRQGDEGDLAGIADWASKLAGAVARIAGGLHLMQHAQHPEPWTVPISAETVAASWAIGREYLIPQALAVFQLMGADPGEASASHILRWVKRKCLSEFSLRDCCHDHPSLSQDKDILPALAALVQRGYMRMKPRPDQPSGSRTAGRPKSERYLVNPLWLDDSGGK